MSRISRIKLLAINVLVVLACAAKTAYDVVDPTPKFFAARSAFTEPRLYDRNGIPLSVSYPGLWNSFDQVALHKMPLLLQQAFVLAEDKRFYDHHGVDWQARGNALLSAVLELGVNRGASTITEQVVRMLHPRKRSLWSKWIEGWEARRLENGVSKTDILEFYLNQVPYGSNRRGVAQAARLYFGRDLETLSLQELLALAVLVRAPSKYDPAKGQVSIAGAIARLAERLNESGQLAPERMSEINRTKIVLSKANALIDASHFVSFVRRQISNETKTEPGSVPRTTLDVRLQQDVANLLVTRLEQLRSRRVAHGAVLVVDHWSGEVLAWVSTGVDCAKNPQAAGCAIDMILRPRQPGSALKPFLYAAALEKGWSAASVIEDLPYSKAVGHGLHAFRDYSRSYYGGVTLRQALGNSLNVPAVHAIEYVGVQDYYSLLQKLRIASLTRAPQFYDEGLALGSGEVTLLELVRAYRVLANHGQYRPLTILVQDNSSSIPEQIFSDEVTSIIGNILSDPNARALEFGRSSVLNFAVQTAVKTGTSTDYRDSWAVGYDSRYVVGVWIGNVDRKPMDGVTGVIGPALLLRSVMSGLQQKNAQSRPLYLSPKLTTRQICRALTRGVAEDNACVEYVEYFVSGSNSLQHQTVQAAPGPTLARPTPGLMIAHDPRVPSEKQRFEMRLTGTLPEDRVEWVINGKTLANESAATLLWPVARGEHLVQTVVYRRNEPIYRSAPTQFTVK